MSVRTWTPRHDRILEALDAAVLLPALREALDLPGESETADRHLLGAMLREPTLGPALHLLERGEPATLRREIATRFPARLAPVVVHHLSLAWRRAGRDELQVEGLRGMLWLLDQRREYLHRIASASTSAEVADAALDDLVGQLVASELAHLCRVGTAGEDREAARRARSRLDALEAALTVDRVRAETRAALASVRADAIADAVDHITTHLKTEVAAAETRRVAGEREHLGAVFRTALDAASMLGHQELLTIEVAERAIEMAWPLYQGSEYAAVRALLEPIEPFIEDLGRRLASDEAFGRQSIFADYYVMRAQCLPNDESDRMGRTREQRRLLERGYAVCPIHRNTRVCLATASLNLAVLLLNEVRLSWSAGKKQGHKVDEAAAMIRQAEALRPEHERLDEVRALLDGVRRS